MHISRRIHGIGIKYRSPVRPRRARAILGLVLSLLGSASFLVTVASSQVPTAPTVPKTGNVEASPAVMTVPFQQASDFIVVEGEVEGQHGWLLLDTGAPALLLRDDRFSDALITLRIGATTQKVHANLMPAVPFLHTLEQLTGRPLLGLLGLSCLKPFETILDYRTHILTLVRVDTTGHRLAAGVGPTPKDSLPLTIKSENGFRYYRLSVTATLGRVQDSFVLDTGAPNNGLEPAFLADSGTHCVRADKGEKSPFWDCPSMTISHHTCGSKLTRL